MSSTFFHGTGSLSILQFCINYVQNFSTASMKKYFKTISNNQFISLKNINVQIYYGEQSYIEYFFKGWL